MTITLTAILALAAGWCIGYMGRALRQAAVRVELLARPVDGPPLTDRQQAILDQLDASLRPHPGPRPDDRSSTA